LLIASNVAKLNANKLSEIFYLLDLTLVAEKENNCDRNDFNLPL